MSDCTIQRSSVDTLRREVEKYRALIEATGTGFVILGDDCVVIDANAEYVRLTGRPGRDDVIGHSVMEWMAVEDVAKKDALLKKCLAEGAIWGIEVDYVDSAGTLTPVEVNANVVEFDGGRRIMALCRDISERRLSDRKLREAERRTADIVEFLPDAALVVDLDGRVIVWNRAMEELTAVKAVDVLNKGDHEYALPFYGARQPVLLDFILTGSETILRQYTSVEVVGESVTAEAPLEVNGRKRYLWLKAHPLYDGEGRLAGAIETVHDGTAHKEAEQALLEAETMVKQILNSVGTGIVIVDGATHEIVDINDHALKLIGTDRETAVGKVCHRFICPAQRGACPISDLKKRVDNSERVLLTAKGRPIPILKSVTPVVRNGRSLLIESFWDITDRKRAEEALKLDESRLAALLQLHRMVGVTESEITYFAMAEAVRLTGSTIGYIAFPDETESNLTVYRWSSGLGNEQRNRTEPTVHPVVETGPWCEVVRLRRVIVANRGGRSCPGAGETPHGSPPLTRHLDVPIFDGDRIVLVAGVGNKAADYDEADTRQLTLFMSGLWSIIQRRRSQEQAVMLQEKLERAQRMESLGVLAGGVAHDLNNMLGPVVGFSELVLRELPAESKLAGRVAKIMKSAQDAADVIQDLLTLARRGRYEMNPLLVNDVVVSYLESPGFASLKNRHPNVTVAFNLAVDLKPVRGSHVHLSKVIMNLVSNACEAMTGGGTLSLRTELHHLTALFSGFDRIEEGDFMVLRVEDTGTGIEPGDLPNIFEPYYSKKKMGHSGSGLGLSVVYGVVKDHGGYYDVFSEPGKGTEFVLYFPVCDEPLPVKDTPAAAAGGAERVLIVDDAPEQRDLAREIMATLGYQVEVAENGHEALRMLGRQSFDIVLLDMIMEPGFDGLDTYREIIKIRPGQKAIIVSGFAATERVREMQELGSGAYVRKPYDIDALAKALREELDRPSHRPAIQPPT